MRIPISRIFSWLAISVVALFILWTIAPILLMVYASLAYSGITIDNANNIHLGLQNYQTVLQDPVNNFLASLITSLILSSAVCLLSLLLGIPAAYALARSRGTINKLVGGWIFSTRFLPPVVAAIPLFVLMRPLGLVGNLWGLVLIDLLLGLSFTIWILRSYIQEVPVTLDHLAILDGLSWHSRFYYALLPSLKKPLVTAAAMTWLMIWNEYFFALLFGGGTRTLTVLIASWTTYQGVQWGLACAAGVMTLIPAAFVLLLSFKLIIRGIAFGWKEI